MNENDDEIKEDDGHPGVPTDLLELHVELEDAGISAEEFKEVYGSETGNES